MIYIYTQEWNSPANSSVRLLLAECPGSQMLNELQRDFKICFFRDGAQVIDVHDTWNSDDDADYQHCGLRLTFMLLFEMSGGLRYAESFPISAIPRHG